MGRSQFGKGDQSMLTEGLKMDVHEPCEQDVIRPDVTDHALEGSSGSAHGDASGVLQQIGKPIAHERTFILVEFGSIPAVHTDVALG